MNIVISNSSDSPIYEQIENQLKEKIVLGEFETGELLPSIRILAKELRISVITTKRAYEELEREGYIETVPGKGSFVSCKNKELMKEELLKNIEDGLLKIVGNAKKLGINKEEINQLVSYLYDDI